MLKKYAVYNVSGEILQTLSCNPRSALLQETEGSLVVEVQSYVSDASHFVRNSIVAAKSRMNFLISPLFILANGTDEAIISNIPAGVQVEWPDGQTDIVTDGEIRFSVDLPGTYTFRFTAVSYLNKEITIEAISAN